MSYLVTSKLSSRISHLPRQPQKAATTDILWMRDKLPFMVLCTPWSLNPSASAHMNCSTSWKAAEEIWQGACNPILLHCSWTQLKEVSRHFSFSPFKTGFSSPQKFSGMGSFTIWNSLSFILVCLIFNCTVKKQWGSYSGHCCLTPDGLHTDIFSSQVWECSYVSWPILEN